LENWTGFLLAAFALTGSPGPATLSLAAASAAFGPRASLGFTLGLIAGILVVMIAVATGMVGILLELPGVAPVIAVLAAVYFVYLAYRIATAPPSQARSAAGRPPSFAGGCLLSMFNPKAYIAMAALFSGHGLIPGHPVTDAVLKASILAVVIALVDAAWLVGGSGLARLCRGPRANRALNLAFAVLLLASAILLVPM
jgi:threonine/homoserine/homoserine lactone efflux protein